MRWNRGRLPLTGEASAPRLPGPTMTRTAAPSPSVLREPIRGSGAPRSPEETHAVRSVRRMASEDACGELVARVRADVDARLAALLETRVAEARSRGAEVEAVADAVRSL